MDTMYQRAFDVLTSSKLVEALNVEKEPVQVRERYGRGSSRHLGDGGPMWNDQLLMARRLVEAGARVVTVAYGFWDTHGSNFRYLRQHLPHGQRHLLILSIDNLRNLQRTHTINLARRRIGLLRVQHVQKPSGLRIHIILPLSVTRAAAEPPPCTDQRCPSYPLVAGYGRGLPPPWFVPRPVRA